MTAGNISSHHVNAPGSESLRAISEELGNQSQRGWIPGSCPCSSRNRFEMTEKVLFFQVCLLNIIQLICTGKNRKGYFYLTNKKTVLVASFWNVIYILGSSSPYSVSESTFTIFYYNFEQLVLTPNYSGQLLQQHYARTSIFLGGLAPLLFQIRMHFYTPNEIWTTVGMHLL